MRIFLKLGIVEHTGHGVPKIIAKYGRQAFDIHDSYINVVIPFNKKVLETLDPYKNKTNNNENSDDLSDKEKRVLMELVNNPKIAYQELVDDLSVSRRTISRIFESLTNKEYIQRIGTNKTGYWKVLK